MKSFYLCQRESGRRQSSMPARGMSARQGAAYGGKRFLPLIYGLWHIFRSKAGTAFTASITPQGAKNESVADPLRHAADAPAGRRAQHAPDPRRHAAHRTAAAHGRRGRTTRGRYMQFLRPRNRFRLPPDRGLPPPLQARLRGSVMLIGPHAGALRRGLHPQARRRQNRPAAAGHPFHRFPETGSQVRFRRRRRVLFGRRPRSCAAATCCSTRRR